MEVLFLFCVFFLFILTSWRQALFYPFVGADFNQIKVLSRFLTPRFVIASSSVIDSNSNQEVRTKQVYTARLLS